jgi:hypothetical protein
MAARRNNPAKAKIVETLPDLGDAELGELFVDITNNRIYVRVITGWKYASLT